ncbi:MAG: lysophospholipase [Ruminococcus sp.]|nr:lysophospholipase [Ruminococcus sp.]
MERWHLEKLELIKQYHIKNQSAVKGGVVFTGSSLMEMFPIEQWVAELPEPRPLVYNRGVGGYKIDELLPIIDICVTELAPEKVFINIGTNDLSDGRIPIPQIIDNYDKILREIENALPEAVIYLMAYYPVNFQAASDEMKECLRIRTNEKINAANAEVEKLAKRHGQRYIDINANLKDSQGRLKAEYTIEGMHINPEGYRAIFDDLMRYVTEK